MRDITRALTITFQIKILVRKEKIAITRLQQLNRLITEIEQKRVLFTRRYVQAVYFHTQVDKPQ